MNMTPRVELLRKFGAFEGKKSRVFRAAAVVGLRGYKRCAVVTAAGSGIETDYHLVHILPIAPEDVDRTESPLETQTDEFRLYSWNGLLQFLEAFGTGAPDETLYAITERSRKHRPEFAR